MTNKDKSKANTSKDKKNSVKSNVVTSKSKISKIKHVPNPNATGRPALIDQIDQDFLDALTTYASQSLNNVEIAKILNISLTSFYKLMRISPDFKQAYEQGIDDRKYALEQALFKRAEGFAATETQTTTDADGNKTIKITDKHFVPDSTALIFSLKNVYADKYKDRVESVNTVNINVNQIQNLPDEELLKYANVDMLDSTDYQIE